jgi:hypothetical protein
VFDAGRSRLETVKQTIPAGCGSIARLRRFLKQEAHRLNALKSKTWITDNTETYIE